MGGGEGSVRCKSYPCLSRGERALESFTVAESHKFVSEGQLNHLGQRNRSGSPRSNPATPAQRPELNSGWLDSQPTSQPAQPANCVHHTSEASQPLISPTFSLLSTSCSAPTAASSSNKRGINKRMQSGLHSAGLPCSLPSPRSN